MENNIQKFAEVLEEQNERELEELREGLQEAPITEEDEKDIEQMIQEEGNSAYVVRNGEKEIPLDDYMKPVDDAILTMKDGTKLISMTQSDQTTEYISGIVAKTADTVRKNAIKPISEKEFIDLSHETLAAIKQYLKVDKLHRDSAMRELSRLHFNDLCEIVPRKLIDTFVDPFTIRGNKNNAKEILLNIIDFMINSGPESDDFVQYLENQNKLYAVLQALAEENFKVKEFLSSKETVAQMAKNALEKADPRTAIYAKYVSSPDAINMLFTHRAAVNREFATASGEIRINCSEQIELDAIDHEIEEANDKADMYESTLKLEVFTEVCDRFFEEFGRDKRRSAQGLERMAKKYLERLTRANLDAPFPGYTGAEHNTGEIYVNYTKHFKHHAALYNKFVTNANEKEQEKLPLIDDIKIFSDTLLIIMGRLQKKLLKEPVTYRNKSAVVVYFELMCRLCTDIFTTAKVVSLLEPVKDLI